MRNSRRHASLEAHKPFLRKNGIEYVRAAPLRAVSALGIAAVPVL